MNKIKNKTIVDGISNQLFYYNLADPCLSNSGNPTYCQIIKHWPPYKLCMYVNICKIQEKSINFLHNQTCFKPNIYILVVICCCSFNIWCSVTQISLVAQISPNTKATLSFRFNAGFYSYTLQLGQVYLNSKLRLLIIFLLPNPESVGTYS